MFDFLDEIVDGINIDFNGLICIEFLVWDIIFSEFSFGIFDNI